MPGQRGGRGRGSGTFTARGPTIGASWRVLAASAADAGGTTSRVDGELPSVRSRSCMCGPGGRRPAPRVRGTSPRLADTAKCHQPAASFTRAGRDLSIWITSAVSNTTATQPPVALAMYVFKWPSRVP